MLCLQKIQMLYLQKNTNAVYVSGDGKNLEHKKHKCCVQQLQGLHPGAVTQSTSTLPSLHERNHCFAFS